MYSIVNIFFRIIFVALLYVQLSACGGGNENSNAIPELQVGDINWNWVDGSTGVNQWGDYGIMGVASESNVPGARRSSVTWVDTEGNLWLFGGIGYDSVGDYGFFNDLWKWDGNNWTWVSGSNVVDQPGIYNIADGTLTPGARQLATSWSDNAGNFWLFGGDGIDSGRGRGRLNDLWRWDGASWSWISGSDVASQYGDYGELNVANSLNVPGGRISASSWIDSNGDVWLFGGHGYGEVFVSPFGWGLLSDLWKWDGVNWTWMSGSKFVDQSAVYGSKGVANIANDPGGRTNAASWIDSNNHLWMFGGGTVTGAKYNNDLWRWDGVNWTWMSGSNAGSQVGVYGEKGIPDASNVPGARVGSVSWVDVNDHLWLFGGAGKDKNADTGFLSDVWKWDGTYWTWVAGGSVADLNASYQSGNTAPGGRSSVVGWTTSSNVLWIFGGQVHNHTQDTFLYYRNDLWNYNY